MKKKVKDLTLTEINKYCLSHRYCDNCVFNKSEHCIISNIDYTYDLQDREKDLLESEVEVDE